MSQTETQIKAVYKQRGRLEVETGKELWSPGDLINSGIDEFRMFDKHCRLLQVTTIAESDEEFKKCQL